MTHAEKITAALGALNLLIFVASLVVAFLVYRWNDRQKKKDRALDLYKSLMTSEFLLKARITSHQYLLEDPRNDIYTKFKGLNFDELEALLRLEGSERESTDRLLLRAIPNFFGAVDIAWKQGYLLKDEGIFAEIYAWYWVNIIEERQVLGNPMFSFHSWMTTTAMLQKARQDRTLRLSSLHKPTRLTPNHSIEGIVKG